MIIKNEKLAIELFVPDKPIVLYLDNPISKFSIDSFQQAFEDKNTEIIIDQQVIKKFKFINLDSVTIKDINKVIRLTISSIIQNNSDIYNNFSELEKTMFSSKFYQGLSDLNLYFDIEDFVMPKLISIDDILDLIIDIQMCDNTIKALIKCLNFMYSDVYFIIYTHHHINTLVQSNNFSNVQIIAHASQITKNEVFVKHGLFIPGGGTVIEHKIFASDIPMIKYIFNDIVIKNFQFQKDEIKEIIKQKYKMDPNLILHVTNKTYNT